MGRIASGRICSSIRLSHLGFLKIIIGSVNKDNDTILERFYFLLVSYFGLFLMVPKINHNFSENRLVVELY